MTGVNDLKLLEMYKLDMKTIDFKKILLPHDGSECASMILPHAASLAKTLHAEIVLLHVTTPYIHEFSFSGLYDIGTPTSSGAYSQFLQDMTKKIREAATKDLEKVKQELITKGVKKVTSKVLEGYPPEIILYTAQHEKIDLIMMSTHGRTGLKKVLIGSVAEQIIHQATCPVFTVHPNQKDIKKMKRG